MWAGKNTAAQQPDLHCAERGGERLEGLILKGVGSFYTVLDADGTEHVCKARGRFRKESISPAPGDRVVFTHKTGEYGSIAQILPRKNLLTRPAVANVDKLMIVMAASVPKPDLLLVDKLLLQCAQTGIVPALIVNKCDERERETFDAIFHQYAASGYALHAVSAHTGEGLDALRAEISGSVCCFAGQSAVGKSSLLNAILPELSLAVGGLSRKTERGRHTTRHAELWLAYGGALVDTPGFSLLETEAIEPEDLAALYPEMRKHAGECRFAQCLHVSEPGCAVKPLLDNGKLSRERYERYLLILEELKEKRKHRYD